MKTGAITPILVLLLVANGTPVLARNLSGAWFNWPLDLGMRFVDGQPLLGRSKTFRGVVVALLATATVAPLLGLSWQLGALTASASMAGDLLSSFVKRRLMLVPSSM